MDEETNDDFEGADETKTCVQCESEFKGEGDLCPDCETESANMQ